MVRSESKKKKKKVEKLIEKLTASAPPGARLEISGDKFFYVYSVEWDGNAIEIVEDARKSGRCELLRFAAGAVIRDYEDFRRRMNARETPKRLKRFGCRVIKEEDGTVTVVLTADCIERLASEYIKRSAKPMRKRKKKGEEEPLDWEEQLELLLRSQKNLG